MGDKKTFTNLEVGDTVYYCCVRGVMGYNALKHAPSITLRKMQVAKLPYKYVARNDWFERFYIKLIDEDGKTNRIELDLRIEERRLKDSLRRNSDVNNSLRVESSVLDADEFIGVTKEGVMKTVMARLEQLLIWDVEILDSLKIAYRLNTEELKPLNAMVCDDAMDAKKKDLHDLHVGNYVYCLANKKSGFEWVKSKIVSNNISDRFTILYKKGRAEVVFKNKKDDGCFAGTCRFGTVGRTKEDVKQFAINDINTKLANIQESIDEVEELCKRYKNLMVEAEKI